MDLATKIEASDATVIRGIQSLGFDGLPHLKTAIAEKLDQGVRTPVEKVGVTLSHLSQDKDRAPFHLVAESYASMLATLSRLPLAQEIEAAVRLLNNAKRIGLYGGGPPNALARQTATHLTRIGRYGFVLEDSGHAFSDQVMGLQPDDAVIIIAYGTALKEALLIKTEIQRIGGKLVVITDNPNGRVARGADAVVEVPRTEVGNMMLYGTILMALETIVLSLTREDPDRSLSAAGRLRDLRSQLKQQE